MRFRIPFLRVVALPAILVGLFLAACHLGEEEKVDATISFNQIFDSLKQYDNVVISLKDKDGNTIDVVFEGKVKVPGDVEKLGAPHWDGGQITVSIIGYKDGKIVRNTETGFNGATNKKDSTYVYLDSTTGLSYAGGAIPMLEGDSTNLPPIAITPANLKIKTLKWVSSAPDVIRVGTTGFKALKAGNAQITVSLDADPSKQFVISVTVVDPAKIPESLAFSADTLKLSAGGAPGRLDVQFVPSTAAKDLLWAIHDTTVATVAADGTVKGVKAGETRLLATSSIKASAADTAVIVVTQPAPPEKVIFAKTETEIFQGGAAESLLASILPPEANQEVEFTVTTPLLIELNNGRISGLGAGEGLVIARSKENPMLADTLKVKITVKQVVTSVTLGKKTLTVFTGGDEPVLTAVIEPSTSNQKVQWRAGQPTIAKVSDAGMVTGVSPGHTRIHAISLVDSTMHDSAEITVKTDAPMVDNGRPDTTVSVGSTVKFLPVVSAQEFGVVVAFRWDVDGLPGWDDTAKAVQEVTVKFDQEMDYSLRFYVRDSEGNETIATKKVSAVIGPVVTIVEPADGAYFTTPSIKIAWKIDNVAQIAGTDTVLKDGDNTIVRTAKDAAGKVFSTSVTVYLDTVSPAKPTVKGPSGIASGKPTWTWSPGGGGNGTYRIAMDSLVFAGPGIKDTFYIPATALAEGVHTFYVQERDAAGNWSLPGKLTTSVDLSGPSKPLVKINVASPSNVKKPIWTWGTGGGAGNGIFQFKFDDNNFTAGASAPAADTQFIPAANLGDGLHTLYVRERDSLGNWSDLGNSAITIDTLAPGAPKVNGSAVTNTNPKWNWTSSGNGGSGEYRWKQDNTDLTTGATTGRDTTFTASAFTNGGSYVLYVQERDAAGNWSQNGSFTTKVNTSGPPSPIISVDPASPTNSKTPKWSWKSGGGGGGIFQYRMDNSEVAAGTISTDTTLMVTLSNGSHILFVREKDNIGNWGAIGNRAITIDTIPPAAPNVTVTPTSPTKDPRPVWTWTAGGGGRNYYRVKLGDENWNFGAIFGPTPSFKPSADLSEGTQTLYVQEQDSAGNWSASGLRQITLDFTPPSKPIMNSSIPISPVGSLKPTWTWTSSGNGGNGNFRVKINNSDLNSGATAVNFPSTNYSPSNPLPEGNNILYVQEQDAAGNWSASTSRNLYCLDPGQLGGSPSGNNHPYQGLQLIVTNTGIPFVWVRSGTSGSDDISYFSGNAWHNTNLGKTSSGASGSLRLNPNTGSATFSFSDDNNYTQVLNFSGSGWNQLTSLQAAADISSLAFNRSGSPIAMAYPRGDSLSSWRYYSSGMWIKEFPNFAPEFWTAQDRLKLMIDTTIDAPYLHIKSDYNTNQFHLWTFRNSIWSNLGSTGLPDYHLFGIQVGVNQKGKVYAITSDSPDGSTKKASVYQYDGVSKWITVGGKFPFVPATETNGLALAFNSAAQPVVAMTESGMVTVYVYDGTIWVRMGSASVVDGANDLALAIGPNDEAYLAFGGTVRVFKFGIDPK